MKAIIILGITLCLAGFMAWRMRVGVADYTTVTETPPIALTAIENPQQLEQRLYQAVGLLLQTSQRYRWSEITGQIEICALTPCRDGTAGPLGAATLRIGSPQTGVGRLRRDRRVGEGCWQRGRPRN